MMMHNYVCTKYMYIYLTEWSIGSCQLCQHITWAPLSGTHGASNNQFAIWHKISKILIFLANRDHPCRSNISCIVCAKLIMLVFARLKVGKFQKWFKLINHKYKNYHTCYITCMCMVIFVFVHAIDSLKSLLEICLMKVKVLTVLLRWLSAIWIY